MTKKVFSPIILVGIAGILLIALFITSAVSGITIDKPASNHYNNKSLNGFFGLHKLIKGLNTKTTIDTTNYLNTENKSVIFYLDGSESDQFLISEALNWVSRGNNLITNGNTANIIFKKDILQSGENIDIKFLSDELSDITELKTQLYLSSIYMDLFDEYEIIAETNDGPFIIKGYIGKGSITLVATFDFFNNYMFYSNTIKKGYVFEYIIRPFADEKIFLREKLGTLTTNPSFIRDFFTGNYSYITIHITVLFILVVIYLGKRFVKPQQLVVKKQKRITEHIYAVGNLYKRADAKDLIRSIDIAFFKTVICRNKIPFNIKEVDYNNAVKEEGFKNGFILRDTLQKIIKERKSND